MFDPTILVNIGLIIMGIGVVIFIFGISFIDAAIFGHDMPLAKITGMALLLIGAIISLVGLGEGGLAFIIFGLLVGFIWLINYMMKGDKESYITFLGRQAIVTIPAKENRVGEIKVISPQGKTYTFIAQPSFHARNKTFKKGDHVYITKFNGIIAEYDTTPPPQPILNQQDTGKTTENAVGQCIVCFLPIKPDDDYIKTPCCNSFAHTTHILEWVKIKGTCPNCQQPLSFENTTLVVKTNSS